ncbi:MAG: M20 metallopeptidase family protein [Candidatus Aminicenantia bacterium]
MKRIILLVLIPFFISELFAEKDILEIVKKKSLEFYPEAVKLRRELHQMPEPCFQEKETSQYIIKYLEKLGLEIKKGIAGTGVKAILKGRSSTPVVGIRADMDALPIKESTGLPFSSKNEGYMHACAHDAHMTNVLISAKILSRLREQIQGTIVFIFQPCEEGSPKGKSGAHVMIEEGVLDNPKIDAMLGLHVMPDFPAGSVALRPGPLMANVASFEILIKGKSSHGALPHQGIDAIYVSAIAIVQFQAIISRLKDPGEKAVLSVGVIKGGTASNVIADRVELLGTVRTFSFDLENSIEKKMRDLLQGLALTYGIDFEFKFNRVARFVKNDPILTEIIADSFREVIGEKNVITSEPLTIAEDFSAYSHTIPSVFFFLGTGTEEKLHSPEFTINEEILKRGSLLLCTGAIKTLSYLKTHKKITHNFSSSLIPF